MSIKKLLFPLLLVIGGLAFFYRLFARMLAAEAPASRETPYNAIDAYILQQMHRLNIPGGSLAIVEGERIVHLKGFGKARPDGKVPAPQTPFFIGSLTKSITALAVMQLVEAGKVELDAPVQRYLPWFRVADPQASAQMTVRHLLNQTSGLTFLLSNAILANLDQSPDATERQVRLLSRFKLNRPVGSKFEYCNMNYNILGLVIEAASGESYVNYIQRHIFEPLEMSQTYTSKTAVQQNGLARGHRHWFSLPFPAPELPVPLGSLPSGQLISCTEDMAHYLIAHLNGGRYSQVQILSAAGIAELHRGVAEQLVFGKSVGAYGMGWFEVDLGQTKTFSHGGNVPDFSGFMGLVPEQKRGMVLLLNADPYGLPFITEEVGMGVTALLAEQQPPPIQLDFIQWIMRLLPLLPLLQLAGVVATLRLSSQWRRDAALRPDGGRLWGRYLLLPLLPNLALAATLAYLKSSGLLGFMHLFMPDLAWTARISGGFAGIWAFLRSALILRAARKSG